MATYFILYTVTIFGGIYSYRIKQAKGYFVFEILLLLFVSTCRAPFIGADYDSYIELCNGIKAGTFAFNDIGFDTLVRLSGRIGDSYIITTLFINLFIIGIVALVYFKKLEKTTLCLAMAIWFLNPYCYIQGTFNMVRQGCAMALVLVAVYHLAKRKNLHFFFFVAVATAFHHMAVVFIILFFIVKIRWNKKRLGIIALICFAFSILVRNSSFMVPFAKIVGEESYLVREASKQDNPVSILLAALIIYILLKSYEHLYKNQEEKVYVDILILSLCGFFMLVKNDQAYRLYVYFLYISPISLVIAINNIKEKYPLRRQVLQYGYIGYYFALSAGFILLQAVRNNIHYFPFRYFWER